MIFLSIPITNLGLQSFAKKVLREDVRSRFPTIMKSIRQSSSRIGRDLRLVSESLDLSFVLAWLIYETITEIEHWKKERSIWHGENRETIARAKSLLILEIVIISYFSRHSLLSSVWFTHAIYIEIIIEKRFVVDKQRDK